MKTHPITERCRQALQSKRHVCFGISPFNSYFSDQKLRELASWGKREFEGMHFFVPDVPSAWTLEALGYPPEKAAWKARRQAQYLYNKIQKSLLNLGYSQTESQSMFLGWEALSANSNYLNQWEAIKQLYQEDEYFKSACTEASKWVLQKRTQDSADLTPAMLDSAVRYLLAEIPLFVDSATIVGVKQSVFCYHQCIPFLETLFNNGFPVAVAPNQGFVVIESKQVEQMSVRLENTQNASHPSFDSHSTLTSLI